MALPVSVERALCLQGVQPDVATYNVLLQACERQNKLDIIGQLISQVRVS